MLCCPNNSSTTTPTVLGKKLVVAIKALMITQLALACFSFVFSPYEGVIEMVFSLFLYCAYTQLNYCSCLVYIFFSIVRLFMIFVWSGLMIQNSRPFFTNDQKSNSFTILNIMSTMYYSISIYLCFQSYKEFKGIAQDNRLRMLNSSDSGVSYQSYTIDYSNNQILNQGPASESASSSSSVTRNNRLGVNPPHNRGNSALSISSVRVSGIADLASNDEELQRKRGEQIATHQAENHLERKILTEDVTNHITEPYSAAIEHQKGDSRFSFENKDPPSQQEASFRKSFGSKEERDLNDSATKRIYENEEKLDFEMVRGSDDRSSRQISRSLSLK